MKKVLLAALAFATVFTACNDNDDDKNNDPKPQTVSATTAIEGATDVKKVVAIYEKDDIVSRADAETPAIENELASSEFKDGKFALSLPAPLTSDKLGALEFGEGITATPATVKGLVVYFIGYNEANEDLGAFYETNKEGTQSAGWIYVDNKVTIKGEYTDEEGNVEVWDNVTLNKGWNKVYVKEEVITPEEGGEAATEPTVENYKYTYTTNSNGISVNWIYEAFDEPETPETPEE